MNIPVSSYMRTVYTSAKNISNIVLGILIMQTSDFSDYIRDRYEHLTTVCCCLKAILRLMMESGSDTRSCLAYLFKQLEKKKDAPNKTCPPNSTASRTNNRFT